PGFEGYLAVDVPIVCPVDPNKSVLLNGNLVADPTTSTMLFRPVSHLSLEVSLFVAMAPVSVTNVTPFTNAFLRAHKQENDDKNDDRAQFFGSSGSVFFGTSLLALFGTRLRIRRSRLSLRHASQG